MSLLEEAKLLASNNKTERAMFLTVIAIEEMGKISMYMNSIQYGKDLKEFWKKFDKYKRQHQFKIFRSLIFKKNMDLNFDFDFKDSEDLSKEINRIKMSCMYVDIKEDKIVTPFSSENLEDYSNFDDFASKLMDNHMTLFRNGYYEENFLRAMKDFYDDEEIQKLLHDLFNGKINPEDYIGKLASIALAKENDIFAQVLLSGIYASLTGKETQ